MLPCLVVHSQVHIDLTHKIMKQQSLLDIIWNGPEYVCPVSSSALNVFVYMPTADHAIGVLETAIKKHGGLA